MTCAGKTKTGKPCRSKAVRDDGYCYFHSPALPVEAQREMARQAGVASGIARREQGKSVRQRLADAAQEHVDELVGAFRDGLRSDDERVRIGAAVQWIEQAYGKAPVAIVGDEERPVEFRVISAFAAGVATADAPAIEGGDE